ncbi:312_t:CDS:2, partial [Acaulospora colombiana]
LESLTAIPSLTIILASTWPNPLQSHRPAGPDNGALSSVQANLPPLGIVQDAQELTTNAHAFHKQAYELLREKADFARRVYDHASLSSLDKVRRVSDKVAELEEIEPPQFDTTDLSQYIERVADMLCHLASDPDNFSAEDYRNVLREVNDKNLSSSDKMQQYYLRLYSRPRDQAMEEFRRYMEAQPVDMAWAA